jgi:hypothetical protein
MADRKAEDLVYAVAVDVNEGKIRTAAQATEQLAQATADAAESSRRAHMNVVAYMRQIENLKAGSEKYNQVVREMSQNGFVLVGTENRLISVINQKTGAIAKSREELSRTAATQKEHITAVDRMTAAERDEMNARQTSAQMFTRYYNALAQITRLEHTSAEDRTAAIESFRNMSVAQQAEETKLVEAHLKQLDAQKKLSAQGSEYSKVQKDLIAQQEKAVDAFYRQIRPAQELEVRFHNLKKAGVDMKQVAQVYSREIIAAADIHRKFGQEIPKLVAELEKEARAVEEASGKKGGGGFAGFGKAIQEFMQHPVQSLKAGMGSITGALGAVGVAFVSVAAGAALAGKGIVDVAAKFGKTAQAIRNQAEMAGMTTTQVQSLQRAAEIMGVQSDIIQKFSFLQMQLGREGGGAFQKALVAMGIAVEDDYKRTRPLVDLLQEFRARLLNIKDPIRQHNEALAAVGRYNTDLVKVLLSSKENWFKLAEEIGRTSTVYSESALAKGEELDSNLERINNKVIAFKNNLKVLAAEIVGPFAAAMVKWIEWSDKSANKDIGPAGVPMAEIARATAGMPPDVYRRYMAELYKKDAEKKKKEEADKMLNQIVGPPLPPDYEKNMRLQREIFESQVDLIAQGKQDLALHKQLIEAKKELDHMKDIEVDKNKIIKQAGLVAYLEQEVKASEALYSSMGDFANKIKFQQDALDRYARSAAALPERVAKGQIGIYKQILDDGKRLTDSQVSQLTKYVGDSQAIIRGQAIPVFRELVEKSKDQFGMIPINMHDAVYKLATGTERDLREQFLPAWQKTSEYSVGMSKEMSAQILGQIDRMLGSDFKDVREAASKQILQWVQDAADASGNITEEARNKIIDLMESDIPEKRKAGIAAYQAYIMGFVSAQGAVPVAELTNIVAMMRSDSKALQEAGIKDFRMFVDGAMSSLEILPDDYLEILDSLIRDTDLKLSNEGLEAFQRYIDSVVAAHGDLSNALPYIDDYIQSADKRWVTAGKNAHAKYVESITNSMGVVSDEILPVILKNLESGNKNAIDVALDDWEKWKAGVIGAFGTIPEEGLPIIRYLLNSIRTDLQESGEKDWAEYARNAVNAFQEILSQVESAKSYLQLSRGLDRFSAQVNEVLDRFGQLPQGMAEVFGQLAVNAPRELQNKMMPAWSRIIEGMRDEYGDLPPEINKINQQLITQQEKLAVRMVDRFADAFAGITDTFSDRVTDIIFEGGKLKDAIIDAFKDMGKGCVKAMMDEMFSPIKGLMRQLGSVIGQILKNSLSGLTKPLSDWLSGVMQKIGGASTQASTQQSVLQGLPNILGGGEAASGTAAGFSWGNILKAGGTIGGMYMGANALSAQNRGTGGGAMQALLGGGMFGASNLAGLGTASMALTPLGGAFLGGGAMLGIQGMFTKGVKGWAESIGGGAMAGAAIGSIFPIIGTAIGAAIGAAVGAISKGIQALVTGIMGKNAYQAGSMEVARDYGGVQMGEDMYKQLLNQYGISEKEAYPIRKNISSSPVMLQQIGLLAQQQGKMEAFLESLERVGTSWGEFNFREAYEIGELTGDWSELNKVWMETSRIGQSVREDLKDEMEGLLIGASAAREAAKSFMELYKTIEDVGYVSQEFTDFIKENRDELERYAEDSEFFAKKLAEVDEILRKMAENDATLKSMQRNIDGITMLKEALSSFAPQTTDVYTYFLQTGKILPEMQRAIEEAGGSLANFQEVAKLYQLNASMGVMIDHFKETGELVPELRKIFEEWGGSLEVFDQVAAQTPKLVATLNSITDFASGFKSIVPELTPLEEVLSGIADSDTWAKMADMGLDSTKFTKINTMIGLIKNWDTALQNFNETGMIFDNDILSKALLTYGGEAGRNALAQYKAGIDAITPDILNGLSEKLKAAGVRIPGLDEAISEFQKTRQLPEGGMLETLLKQYGGAEGADALAKYYEGFNMITPQLLNKVYGNMTDEFQKEKQLVLDYVGDIYDTTSDQLGNLTDLITQEFNTVGQSISNAFSQASNLIIPILDSILERVKQARLDLLGITSNSSETGTGNVTGTGTGSGNVWRNTTQGIDFSNANFDLATATMDQVMQYMLSQGYNPSTLTQEQINQFLDWQYQQAGMQTPVYAEGGYVPKTQAAIVHAGEYVIPEGSLFKTLFQGGTSSLLSGLFGDTSGNISDFIEKTAEEFKDVVNIVKDKSFITELFSNIGSFPETPIVSGDGGYYPTVVGDQETPITTKWKTPVWKGGSLGDMYRSGSVVEYHFHFEGATINGISDMKKFIVQALDELRGRGAQV